MMLKKFNRELAGLGLPPGPGPDVDPGPITAGDLEPFHLLLQLGSATHLGKGASFGFGAYLLER